MIPDPHTMWLAEVKAGDSVVIQPSFRAFGGVGPKVASVDRTTATHILVGSDRYQRTTGRIIGVAMGQSLRAPTPELLDRVERYQLVRGIADMIRDWREAGPAVVSTEQLREIARLCHADR